MDIATAACDLTAATSDVTAATSDVTTAPSRRGRRFRPAGREVTRFPDQVQLRPNMIPKQCTKSSLAVQKYINVPLPGTYVFCTIKKEAAKNAYTDYTW